MLLKQNSLTGVIFTYAARIKPGSEDFLPVHYYNFMKKTTRSCQRKQKACKFFHQVKKSTLIKTKIKHKGNFMSETNKSEAQEIIQRIKVLREIEEISGETLARELGFDPVEYNKWETGEKDFPVGALVEIASRFNLSPKTIDTHKEHIKLKLHCGTSQELRQLAIEWASNPGTA
jgi:DNA-binding transcriptional regulator YiaG